MAANVAVRPTSSTQWTKVRMALAFCEPSFSSTEPTLRADEQYSFYATATRSFDPVSSALRHWRR